MRTIIDPGVARYSSAEAVTAAEGKWVCMLADPSTKPGAWVTSTKYFPQIGW